MFYGQNPLDFTTLVSRLFHNQARARDFLNILKELWIEANVLRKVAAFLRQSFADPISKADLTDSKSDASKMARGLIPLDTVQARGVKKNTGMRVGSIFDAVQLFVEREAYRI